MAKNIILLGALMALTACASQAVENQELKTNKFYKRDMIVTINGTTFEGVAVAPMASKYDFHVEARGDLDMFLMTSCHKEEQKEKGWNVKKKVRSGLFGWGSKKIDLKREVKFSYIQNSLEKDGDCTLELGGYENRKGRHSWAFIDFESEKYRLPAKMNCNGRTIKSKGTSVCQSRNGLIQDIEFPEDVIVADNNKCGIVAKKARRFEFPIPLGKCTAIFASKTLPTKFHKLTLLGYESLLIRE